VATVLNGEIASLSISPFPYEETSVAKQSETGLIEQRGAAASAGNTGNLFRASGDAMTRTPQLKGAGWQGWFRSATAMIAETQAQVVEAREA
jgi:hypothetical protein